MGSCCTSTSAAPRSRLRPAPAAPACVPPSQAYRKRAPTKALLEFDRDRKSMSVVVGGAGKGAKNGLLVKGAAECVIDRCDK
jgi:magnesium-transporting ATPase (P-type)